MMSDAVGLSVGATNLAGVVVDRTAVLRTPVLTRYPNRPPEVGVPSENSNLTERGLIITDFVDRVGDPVGIVAADGSTHRADEVLADALRAMLYAVGRGRPPAGQVAVTYPAHWRPAAIDALRNALATVPEFQHPKPAPVLSDAVAALTALQNDPGVPTHGVVALCDFGGTGTSITLVDAANGYALIGETVRHTDLCGDLVDQALLTHVIDDLSAAGTIDLSGTSAIGSLSRLRAQCRGAKERLSTSAVTTLVAELPGHRNEVRLTRNELDEAMRQPLADFVGVVRETLERNGVRGGALAAVASVGGGAHIPIVTTTLSEHLRVPVVTTPRPELAAGIGAALAAVRGAVDEGMTAMAAAAPAAAAAAAVTGMAPAAGDFDEMAQSSTFRALAWSDADDVPEVAPTDSYDYPPPGDTAGVADARPDVQFQHEPDEPAVAPVPWYRRPAAGLTGGVLVVLAALVIALVFATRDDTPSPASTTAPTATPPAPTTVAPPPPEPAPAIQAPPPQNRTVYQPPPATRTATAPPPPPATTQPPPETTEPPPATPEPPPPTAEPPPWSPTAPYPTIPGLPWVPAPQPAP